MFKVLNARNLIYILFLFLCCEFVLRLQQKLGPIYDLEMNWLDKKEFDGPPFYKANLLDYQTKNTDIPYIPSHWLNHKPPSSFFYKDSSGQEWIYYYHEDGIRLYPQLKQPSPDKAIRILFLGDSFMQGLDDESNIPVQVLRKLNKRFGNSVPLFIMNAGCASYSPSIFAVQVQKLIPKYQPHIVITTIDFTDLADEAQKYFHLVNKNEKGKTLSVSPSHSVINFENRYRSIRAFRSFFIRFILRLYYRLVPLDQEVLSEPLDYEKYFNLPVVESREKYQKDIAIFQESLRDFFRASLDQLKGNKSRFFVFYHPRKEYSAAYKTPPYPRLMNSLIKEVASKEGIIFFDITDTLLKKGPAEFKTLFLDTDVHYNSKGIGVYSALIEEKIYPSIENIFRERH